MYDRAQYSRLFFLKAIGILGKLAFPTFPMQTPASNQSTEAWVRVLKKGMITLPKALRDQIGIKEGGIAKAKLVGNTIVIEPREEVGYRLFTDEQIQQWLKDDELPEELAKEAEEIWSDIP